MVGQPDFTRWNECLELCIIAHSGLVGCDAVIASLILGVFRDGSAFTVEYLTLQDEGTTGTLAQGHIIGSQKTYSTVVRMLNIMPLITLVNKI